jgi:hypothetical protein
MAEIKSTIDLIMERTKNLSASPEEREAYRRQQLEKHIRGLVQRLLDYSLTLDDVKDDLEREKKKNASDVATFLGKALAAQVDPEADNERLFRIINELTGAPEERLREALAVCRDEFESARALVMKRQTEELSSRGISGSAVLPNSDADAKWKAIREDLLAACAKHTSGVIGG